MKRSLPPGSKSLPENEAARDKKSIGRESGENAVANVNETTSTEAVGAQKGVDRRQIVFIDARGFFRECVVRSVREHVSKEIVSFPSVNDFLANLPRAEASLVILTTSPGPRDHGVVGSELAMLLAAIPEVPVVVLSDRDDRSDAIEAIDQGAKGYISTRTAFAAAIEAFHVVEAGGTYVPTEDLLSMKPPSANSTAQPADGVFTSRELAVMRAIQQGKSNKVIAYDLNMCESTLKLHIRNIMKKLSAHSRTEVALKSGSLVG